jgi:hypothetical protein
MVTGVMTCVLPGGKLRASGGTCLNPSSAEPSFAGASNGQRFSPDLERPRVQLPYKIHPDSSSNLNATADWDATIIATGTNKQTDRHRDQWRS